MQVYSGPPVDQGQLGEEIHSRQVPEGAVIETTKQSKLDEKAAVKLAFCILGTDFCLTYFHPVAYTLLSAATCYLAPRAFFIGVISAFAFEFIGTRRKKQAISDSEKFRTTLAFGALVATRFLPDRFYLPPFCSFVLGFDVGKQARAFTAAYFS